MVKSNENVFLENVQILWPNFSGVKTDYTPAGTRQFNCQLTEDQKKLLLDRGYNVKEHIPTNPEYDTIYTLRIGFGWNSDYPQFDPKIVMVENKRTIPLTKENVGVLDGADIQYADLEIRPYHWTVNKNSGVAAKLATGYFYTQANRVEERYREYAKEEGHLDTIEFQKIEKQHQAGLVGTD